MQLHQARRANLSNKKKVRVGRGPGSGLGKTAGRGIKGATSRSGYAMKVTYEGGQMPLFRRLPKRGFGNGRFMVKYIVINLESLADFPANSVIGLKELRAKGLANGPKGTPVKILGGQSDLKVALTISADAFSKSAIEKIQKAGGKVEWTNGAPKKKAPNFKQIEIAKKLAEKAKPKAAPEGKESKEGGKPEGKAAPEGKAPEAKGAPEGKPAKAPKADAAPKAEGTPAAEAKPAKAPKAEAAPKSEPKADDTK
jgi:large subunit ribosomal protein L15